jgi:hypothetical protein
MSKVAPRPGDAITEAGKVESWEKRGIETARHFVAVLCQAFFKSPNCLRELELAIEAGRSVLLVRSPDSGRDFPPCPSAGV